MAENKYINVNLAKAQFTGNFIDNYPPPLIKALLDSIPAADVEPVKHGHWTEKKISGGGIWDYYFVCSECHHETPNRGYTIAPDYCSGCGAKMDGGEFNE